MKIKFAVLSMCLFMSVAALAQEKYDFNSSPVVPVEVVAKGRKAVVDYLTMQVDYVSLRYTGSSVVGQNDQYLYQDQLNNLGYVHRGSFTELSDVVAKQQFSGNVIKNADGQYDVNVQITYWTADGRTLFNGSGWLNINDGPMARFRQENSSRECP